MYKMLFGFCVGALSIVSAANYKVTLSQPSVLNGTELRAGEYRVELRDNKATVKGDKNVIEADVKIENSPTKFNTTSVRYEKADGKMRIQEMRLGGTNLRVIFDN